MEPSILNDQKISTTRSFSIKRLFHLLLVISLGLNVYFYYEGKEGSAESRELVIVKPELAQAEVPPASPVKMALAPEVVEKPLNVKRASYVSPEHFDGKEVLVLHFKVKDSLNQTVCRVMSQKDDCAYMSAYIGRILAWYLDINRDMRNGDNISIVYKNVKGAERFSMLKLSYQSALLGKTIEANYFQGSDNNYGSYFDNDGVGIPMRISDDQSPIRNYTEITSLPGDFRKGVRGHAGTDFKAEVGTPIFAPFEGKVLRRNWNVRANGYCLEVDHPGTGVKTLYLHLSRVLVKAGQYVKQGEQIAESGNTGKSFAPHLHYELLSRGDKKVVYNPFETKYHKIYHPTVSGSEKELFSQTVRLYDSVLQQS